MNAHKRTLGQIFDPSLRLVVPLFQRPYVWEQSKNWRPLWDSILGVAKKRLAGGVPRPHFLGALVLDQVMTHTGDIESRQVIDGQQRMTTLQLALAAARDLCRAVGDEGFHRAFAKLTANDIPLSKEPDDVFKIWPTNEDRATFRGVMAAGSQEEVCKLFGCPPPADQGSAAPLIANAYLYFYRKLADWLGPKSSEGHANRLRAVWQAVKDDIQVVVIDLDESDDAQVIFETLNALGTPLLPADLVKNFLFQSAEARGDNTEELYKRHWSRFDEGSDFWRAEVGQGRLKRPRIDQFLQHYLTLVTGHEIQASQLFEKFREYAGESPAATPADHLQSLHTYGGIFEKFHTGFDESSQEGRFFRRMEELETTTFFPPLMEVFRPTAKLAPHETASILTDVESFLVRRMVCGLTTKGYNTLVRSLLTKLRGGDCSSAAVVRQFLLSHEAESTRWPTDEQFRAAWLSRPVYRLLTRGRVRTVLEAIELALHTGKSEKVKIESRLTIEHVLPRAWAEHWPLPQGKSAEEAEGQRKELIHTLGNLTLVTGKLNPSMSNSGWAVKRKSLSDHGAFALNRKLSELAVWDESAIERRGVELFGLAKAIWPRPATVGG